MKEVILWIYSIGVLCIAIFIIGGFFLLCGGINLSKIPLLFLFLGGGVLLTCIGKFMSHWEK